LRSSRVLKTTIFGRTGLPVSPICIGTSSWGPPRTGETEADRDRRLLPIAEGYFGKRLSINYLDTSNMYGESQSEVLVGRALRAAGGLADGLVLQTKLDRRLSDGSFSSDQMWRSLEQSLDRLGLTRLQVLYLHDPESIGFDAAMAPGGPVQALIEMKERGLAAHIGISGGPVPMLQRFVQTDVFDALVTHNRFTLVDRSASALLDAANERGLGVTNAAPWGAGVLTGDPRFRNTYGYRPIHPEVRRAVDKIQRICADAGVSMAAVALQFSLREPRVHSTIVGVSSWSRLETTLAYASEAVPEPLWAAIDEVLPPASSALDATR
jgi:D-threo-aldose 1-dehydrogenase